MAFESLYNSLFQHGGMEAVQRMVREYPYFGPAHFFALRQSLQSGEDHGSLAEKAALHFADPLLLHFQLNKREATVSKSLDMPYREPKTEEVPVYEPAAAQPIDNPHFETAETVDDVVQLPGENPGDDQPATVVVEETVMKENKETMKEEPLLFEPLHTTDYFASQGIKLSEAVQSADKMGRQLRSFTEWLKTMKKVHPEGLNEKTIAPAAIDNAVQNMAERSNKEEEVVTEAMANVYLQQGKLHKAREIYKKLSLLNPSKSAYFAAKLNEIQ